MMQQPKRPTPFKRDGDMLTATFYEAEELNPKLGAVEMLGVRYKLEYFDGKSDGLGTRNGRPVRSTTPHWVVTIFLPEDTEQPG